MAANPLMTIVLTAIFCVFLCVTVSDADNNRRGVVRRGKNNSKEPMKYEAKDIDEDVPIGTTILKVKASEFVSNAEIKYSVTDDRFSIDSSGAITNAKQLDADNNNTYYEFNVMATVTTTVRVSVKNKNDQAPKFSQDIYTANVNDDATYDTLVTTVKATDNDGDNIRFGFVEETVPPSGGSTRSSQFAIEESTGNIRLYVDSSFLYCDRYELNVTATDDGACCGRTGPNHTSTAVVVVNVARNDNKHIYCECRSKVQEPNNSSSPVFNQTMYTAIIARNESADSLPYKFLQVKATYDGDEQKLLTYSLRGQGIDPDNPTDSKFGINQTTGEIYVHKPLDSDQPNGRPRLRFTVFAQVEDGQIGCADVEIKLNGSAELFFDKADIETSVYENAEIGTSLATFRVLSHQGNRPNVFFTIDRTTDFRSQFAINENGTVTIKRHLDRETTPRHLLKITAIDYKKGQPTKKAFATLIVIVKDVNDNAPLFSKYMRYYRPVLREHLSPRKVVEIEATDDDDNSKGNGPPFHFQLDPNATEEIRASFKISSNPKGANGEGTAYLSSLRSFDREREKEFHIPIVITDSGEPTVSGTSTLTVIIGDIKDTIIRDDIKEIFVYNYLGQAPDIEVGRVYIEDFVDWELVDKKFYWVTEDHKNFSLNQDTGMLTMRNGTPDGHYRFRFLVSDPKNNQIDVPATVTIIVRTMTDEAVSNSGSIRIAGITDEDFLRTWDDDIQYNAKSKFEKLRKKLAEILDIERDDYVEIFSVKLRQKNPPVTDIHFSARKTTYFQPVKLNGFVLQRREEFEDYVGINITMIGINECLVENKVCQGSCNNVLRINPLAYLINTNKTALVGVQVENQPECTCRARKFIKEESCQNNPCLNGGSCIETENGVSCLCTSRYEGPRCQRIRRAFLGGKLPEWAWYPPLEMCESSHISIEFRATKPDGTLLYNGPMAAPKLDENSDFISLELESGSPRLLIDFGSGTLELKLNGTVLDDGDWHRIDVFWDTENVRMMLDRCDNTILNWKTEWHAK